MGSPCIVKPADEDGSAGMDADSVCVDAAAMERARARIAGRVLVEEFLPGREFVVSLWGQTETGPYLHRRDVIHQRVAADHLRRQMDTPIL